MFSEASVDKAAQSVPDRAKYVGNISYVDEYIGPRLQQLAIAFHDPVALGLTVPDEHTVILGRVGSSIAPVDLGWLAHQVRPIPDGCEMRSRFYLSLYGMHTPDLGETAARAVHPIQYLNQEHEAAHTSGVLALPRCDDVHGQIQWLR